MAITYMQRRRSGVYEFRRMLPRTLAGKPAPSFARTTLAELINPATGRFKRELTVSLKTSDPKEAKRKDAIEVARVSRLFVEAEQVVAAGVAPPPPPPVLEAPDFMRLETEFVTKLLAADEEERQRGDDRRHLQTPEERAQWSHLSKVRPAGSLGMEEDHFHAKGMMIDMLEADFKEALARRDPQIVEASLRDWLRSNGYQVDPPPAWYGMAGLAVLRAHVNAYALLQRRQAGEDVPTPPALVPAFAPDAAVAPPALPKAATLTDAYAAWKAGSSARGAKRPSNRTIMEADHAVRRFVEFHGDLPLAAINREKARSFRDALAAMPTRLTGQLRSMSLPELLTNPVAAALPRPHATTINKSLTLLSAIMAHAEKQGLTDNLAGFANPFSRGVKLTINDRNDESREPFSTDDLKRIFEAPIYAAQSRPRGGGGEGAFWLPLIALLSGARLGEIAQLRVMDLSQDQESGVWFFNINTSGGRSIKTASSRRKVPVHPELERIGLLRYRQALLGAGASPDSSLWPKLEADSAGRKGGRWSRWFNRYLREVAKITETSKVFHSFRHNFKRLARNAELTEEMSDALTGHAGGKSVGRSYGAGFGLRTLGEAIGRLTAPPPVQNLRWDDPRR